ncbi:MAG: glycosyltransferase [Bacteroidota bacterium]
MSSRTNIKSLQISTVYGGGAGRACIRLHEALLEHPAVTSRVLIGQNCPKDALPGVVPLYKNELSSFLHRRWTKLIAGMALRGLPPTEETFMIPRTGHSVHRHPIIDEVDVVNLHWTTRLLDHRSFFKAIQKPLVWTLHDMNPWSGGYPYDRKFPFTAYDQQIKRNLTLQVEALQNIDNLTIVCPSQWLLEASKASKLFGRYRHELIPYSLNTEVFIPQSVTDLRREFGLAADKKVLLFVATQLGHVRKGLHHLIKALRLLADRGDAKNLELAIVGNGRPADLPETLAVRELGRISNEADMAKVYAAADLFVIPSEQDNLPNTVLESLSTGTPVVGFRIGGIPDMVSDPSLGCLAENISPEELALAIGEALTTKFKRQHIRETALARYMPKVQAEAYYQLYLDILPHRG